VSKDTSVWNKLETDEIAPAFGGDKPMSEVGPAVAAKMDEALGKEK
jgi:multiple sugar transport system substrate-binding protein